jgi:hypothetical protein
LIASAALAVLLGAAYASWDVFLATWYAHRLRSENVEVQKAAIASLGQLRTRRAARILAAYLGDADSPVVPRVAGLALMNMGKVAMEPLSEAFQIADDLDGRPKQLLASAYSGVEEMLFALLEIQRDEAVVRPLLENIGSSRLAEAGLRLFTESFASRPDLDDKFGFLSPKYLAWKSGVQAIEGTPCRIFLFEPRLGSWPPKQTILLTDAGGRVITWKEEVGGELTFYSCELDNIDGELILIVTRHDGLSVGRYLYRLTLRGIEEPR